MARNKQPDAITLSLSKTDGNETSVVIFPASASGDRLTVDRVSEQMSAVESFRSAIRLANEMKVAIVVLDPEGVWRSDWGDLYRDVEPAEGPEGASVRRGQAAGI